jgi:hypothetical protein
VVLDIDPLAARVARRFLGHDVVGGVDPELRLRRVEQLTRELIDEIEKDPHNLTVVDLVSTLAEIAHEAKPRR